MSIFDNKLQREYEADILVKKIKNAQAIFDKARENAYGGPGNGCDDYRDPDPEVESAWRCLQSLKAEFSRKFNTSYEQYTSWSTHDMMTAEQARSLYNHTVSKDNTELKEILKKIEKSITEQKQNYCYVNSMKEYTKTKLENLGYEVKHSEGHNYLITF